MVMHKSSATRVKLASIEQPKCPEHETLLEENNFRCLAPRFRQLVRTVAAEIRAIGAACGAVGTDGNAILTI